mgnify:CR=1 FL=1
MRLRPRLRFSDITNKILDSNFSSCGSNGAAAAAAAAAVAAAAQNLSRRAGSACKMHCRCLGLQVDSVGSG